MVYWGTRLPAFCLILIFISISSFAQRCDTYEYYKKYPIINSTFTNRVYDQSNTTRDTVANEVIIIPVVIHILYNNAAQNISDEQVLSQLQSINNDYRKMNSDVSGVPAPFAPLAADSRIAFCLAKVDPAGKTTTGIIRKSTSVVSWLADDGMKYSAQGGDNAWDSKKYLNIWVCNLSGRSLGYSSLPGSQPDRDGVVIQSDAFGTIGTITAPFNKGRTLTHETGHWLGLKHIWGDANCGDDGIADTPPQQNFNNGFPSFPHRTSCSINGNGDMFMNFMDFTDDACMRMFTYGQAQKMRSLFATGSARNSFLGSSACDNNSVQRGATFVPVAATEVISLFPNPAIKFISINSRNSADLVGESVKICNVYGGVVISQLLSGQKTTISIEQLTAGVYFLKIGDGRENKTMRFVKE